MKDLTQNFPYELTGGQREALLRLTKFIDHPDARRIFVLKGYAGTGKTTLLSHITRQLDKKVILLAPTGRAARVLGNYCGKRAYTIHKWIYAIEEEGGLISYRLKKNTATDTLFIVDEASMIAPEKEYGRDDLLTDLMRFVFTGKGCRILLSGDDAQLPPVGFSSSPALDRKYLLSNYKLPVELFTLDEVLRQARNSGILFNATKLRQVLQSGGANVQFDLADFDDIRAIGGDVMEEYLEDSYGRWGQEEVLIITRSNKRANLFNKQVRYRLLFRENEIDAGDMLMAVRNNYYWLKHEKAFIANGETCEVLQVMKREKKYGFEFADVRVRLIDSLYDDLEIKLLLNAIDVDSASLPYTEIRRLYKEVENDYIHFAGKEEHDAEPADDPYYNALQVKFAYAVTCHKAQGGQWKAVFIDQGFLTEEMIDRNWIRWLYTALTRATHRVFLVNFHPRFFGDEE